MYQLLKSDKLRECSLKLHTFAYYLHTRNDLPAISCQLLIIHSITFYFLLVDCVASYWLRDLFLARSSV